MKTLKRFLVLSVLALTLSAFALTANATPRWEDCDLDGFSDATGEPVPWVGFDDTRGDTVPENWDGKTHDWSYYPENKAKTSVSSKAAPKPAETKQESSAVSSKPTAKTDKPTAKTESKASSAPSNTKPTANNTSSEQLTAAASQPGDAKSSAASAESVTAAVQGESGSVSSEAGAKTDAAPEKEGNNTSLIGLIVLGGIAVLGAGAYVVSLFVKKKNINAK